MRRRELLVCGAMAGAAQAAPSWLSAAAAPQRVDIVGTQGVAGLAMHEVARSQGYFTQFGVDPRVLQVTDGAKCVAALISGSAKICMWSGFNQLTPAIERGAGIKILAGALKLPSLAMYSAKPEIRRAADLAGKVIGIGALGSVLHQMTVLLLKKKGVDIAKVQFRNVGSNAEVLKAVIAKTIDAGLSDVDVFDEQARFGIHALSDGLLWQEIPEYINQGSYATDEAIRQDRNLLVRVLAAYAKAYRFVSGPASRAAYVQARIKVTGAANPGHAQTHWNWIQKYQPYATGLALSEAELTLIQQINVDFKVQRRIVPATAIADMTLARDALKLLG